MFKPIHNKKIIALLWNWVPRIYLKMSYNQINTQKYKKLKSFVRLPMGSKNFTA